MGDPETEAVMPRVASDLLPLLDAVARGNLGDLKLDIDPRTAVTVMAVSGGYPGSYAKGKVITGTELAGESLLFHAGTDIDAEGRLVTSGGRVIAATSYGTDIPDAAAKSFKAIGALDFEGKYYRRDIANDLI